MTPASAMALLIMALSVVALVDVVTAEAEYVVLFEVINVVGSASAVAQVVSGCDEEWFTSVVP